MLWTYAVGEVVDQRVELADGTEERLHVLL